MTKIEETTREVKTIQTKLMLGLELTESEKALFALYGYLARGD